jgi:hypothetical protein
MLLKKCRVHIFSKNLVMITKEELNSDLATMKTSLASDFDNLVEFPKEELK